MQQYSVRKFGIFLQIIRKLLHILAEFDIIILICNLERNHQR